MSSYKPYANTCIGRKCPLQVFRLDIPLIYIPPKVFGCVCFAYIPKHQWDKIDPRVVKGIFVGYSSSQKGYKLYDLGKGGRWEILC